jgi:hypothetical protein
MGRANFGPIKVWGGTLTHYVGQGSRLKARHLTKHIKVWPLTQHTGQGLDQFMLHKSIKAEH